MKFRMQQFMILSLFFVSQIALGGAYTPYRFLYSGSVVQFSYNTVVEEPEGTWMSIQHPLDYGNSKTSPFWFGWFYDVGPSCSVKNDNPLYELSDKVFHNFENGAVINLVRKPNSLECDQIRLSKDSEFMH